MAKAQEQMILSMGLPLEMCLRTAVTLYELNGRGDLRLSWDCAEKGQTVTVEEIAEKGNCQDVFMAAKIRRDGKIYWVSVKELEQSAFANVA